MQASQDFLGTKRRNTFALISYRFWEWFQKTHEFLSASALFSIVSLLYSSARLSEMISDTGYSTAVID